MSRAMTLLSLSLCSLVLGAFPENMAAQTPNVNVTTWQQDSAASSICTGCVYRTGQNLSESRIDNTISKSNFGQFCNYTLDGEVYGQPLVVTNVKFQGGVAHTVVYVVTMNDSVYAFDGAPPSPTSNGCTLLAPKIPLLPSGSNETAVDCTQVGGKYCLTIAPKVGTLGTPVISTRTLGDGSTGGTLYAVAESQLPDGSQFYHRLWALDITSLSPVGGSPILILPSGNACPSDPQLFSQKHIQRPALLLAGDSYLYVAFSMMDGTPPPLPNGTIFAYNTANLTSSLCFAFSSGISGSDGGGIWGGGGGPAYGPDANTGTNSKYYTFFNTANGQFGTNSNYGDSFIKMYNTGSALQVSNYFSPGDQYFRSNKGQPGCTGDGDTDFGSGFPMLIPDHENSTNPFLAVSGDKEGGIWFMDRTLPGQGGSMTCMSNMNTNVQTFAINGSGNVGNGPVIHTNAAFWETPGNEQTGGLAHL